MGSAAVVRTRTHTFVHRRYEGDECYDRLADPSEVDNRINDPSLAATVGSLRSMLADWYLETSDVIPWTPDPRFPEIPNGWRSGRP